MTMLSRRDPIGRIASPMDVLNAFAGPEVPDPITFVIGEQWLDRGNLYPRQATLIKLFFLRDDLFTSYDRMVLDEWTTSFAETGNNGTQTDLYRRIEMLKADGYRWFREILLVMGRRAGKGHISALAFAYVLWNYLAKGDPQGFYGVDRDKQLACFIFAGKKEQARLNLFSDLYNVINSGPCFSPYISRAQTDSMTIFAPNDFLRMYKLYERGIVSTKDMATFLLQPKESTLMSGRGPASFCLDPETPVLTADLEWLPIKKLVAGDKVIGFDEFPECKGAQRKMREAEVLRVWRTRQRALKLIFGDGSHVICSPDHRWLFKDHGKGGGYLWRAAERLSAGSRIRHLVDPWEEDRSWESGYLAGFYDGEGCVSGWSGRAGREVFFSQNEGPVLDRVLGLLRAKGFTPQYYTNTGKSCQQWSLGGMVESMAFLGSVRPGRLMAKQRAVWEGVAPRGGLTPSGQVRKDAFKTIVAIEELPEQELVDIETTTHTFIANGLFSHNCQGYDEMAHVVASGANRSAEDVYGAATPALDQFGRDAFIIEPSSPWQKAGQFYENYRQALEVDEETGDPVYPERLMIQLASWDIYKDWEIAHEIELFPAGFRGDLEEYADGELPRLRPLKGAIQTYDLAMQRLEKANPETFKVERRSDWANVMDAYLNENKVKQIFQPWMDRPDEYGRPTLEMQDSGLLIRTYKAHADPSKSNCFAGETRYLTQEGLKSFQETVGTTQRVLGRYGRWVDATVVQAPAERLLRLVMRRQGVDREVFATANHRFPVRVKYSRKDSEIIKTTEELKPGDHVPNRFAAWNPRTTPYPVGIQAGIVYGDGSMTSYGGSHVALWGEKDAALLKWFPHNVTKAVVSAQGCPGVDVFQLPGFFKRDPDLREARGYLLGWLMGYFAADGTVFENGSACFTSRKRHSLEVALTVCDLLGIPHYDIREHNGPGYNGDQPCYYMTIDTEAIGEEFFLIEAHRDRVARRNLRPRRRLPEWTVVSVEETDRVEPVYCVQVPDGERFTLEGNIDVYNCNFGFAIGHAERDANGVLHCVFDRLHHWEPQDWDDHIVDYDEIGEYMVDEVAHKFYPDEITFDQFNSVATIQKINKRLLAEPGPKQVTAYERTATKELNWSRAEVFKTAINMGLVHAPYYELAENELKFLIDKGNKVVDHPDSGPVQTKDVADCMFEVVYYFLGKQVQDMLAALGAERIRGGLQGGTLKVQKAPQLHQPSPHDMFSDFGSNKRMAAQQMGGLSRGHRRR